MIFKNWWHMMKYSRFQVITGIIITSFLLFFVNVLALVAHQVERSREEVQGKLWVYFYLDDVAYDSEVLYAKAIELMWWLEEKWLEVAFYSKEDAFDLLSQRLPDVVGSLEAFNIDNPLPPTLYILFDSQEQYDILKDTLVRYEDMIVNLDDVSSGLSFGEQEQRVAKVINLMNFLKYLSWFLVSITVLIMLVFLLYALRINFFRFRKQLEVEKLLGAPYIKIIAPFLLYIWSILLCSFLLAWWYMWFVFAHIQAYVKDVFFIPLSSVLPAWSSMVWFASIQIVGLLLLHMVFGSFVLWRLLKKI